MAKPGPPRVIVQIRSNERSPPMNDSRITVNVAFRLSGRMTCRNRDPGRRRRAATASKYSSGIDRMPAMKITIAMPDALPDVDERDRQQRDVAGRPASPGRRCRPAPSAVLISPVDGCISTAKVMPTATVLTSTGKKTIDAQQRPAAGCCEVSSTASGRPMHDLQAAGHDRVDDRVAQAVASAPARARNWRSCRGR